METSQKGRSMVEMLGVLAIIGVLSAGALAGYSKAMFRHRVNQTIDIFQGVLQRFVELEQKGWGVGVEIDDATDLIKYGLFQGCQATANNECKLPIGALGMSFINENGIVRGEFNVRLTDSKSCVAFASVGWENAMPEEWFSSTDMSNTEYQGGYIGLTHGCIYNPSGNSSCGEKITTVSLSSITQACQVCDEGECNIWFTVRNDL